jgi:hypothetical protein
MEPILKTDPSLLEILEDLKKREPIFHRPELGTTRDVFENMTAPYFWEVGASGQAYSREYVINTVVNRYLDPAYIDKDKWQTKDFQCYEIAPNNYLLTYILLQDETRVTRRSTIWRKTSNGWQIVYHQGTLVQEKLKD